MVFEPNSTHRVAIQLSYKNKAGETVRVNPYFDVSFDASGRSVQVTDPNKTRVMADVSSCNGCHDKLALHGGGRVDVQYCVLCHSTATTDANSGNVLAMSTMTHKIHAGRLLAWQVRQASLLALVFQLSPCGVFGLAPEWQTLQLRRSCGKPTSE